MLPYPLGDFIDVPPFEKTDYLCGSRSCLCFNGIYLDFLLCGYITARQLFFVFSSLRIVSLGGS